MPEWLKRLLAPKAFGRLSSASSLWNGIRRENFIKKTKGWLKTIGVMVAICLIIWFLVLPILFGSSSPMYDKLQAGMVETLFVRIDDAGIRMRNPLPLTDLLYDRSSKSMTMIRNLQGISDEISNKLLEQGFGTPEGVM